MPHASAVRRSQRTTLPYVVSLTSASALRLYYKGRTVRPSDETRREVTSDFVTESELVLVEKKSECVPCYFLKRNLMNEQTKRARAGADVRT